MNFHDELSLKELVEFMVSQHIFVRNGKKYHCECGSSFQLNNVRSHLRTTKHKNWDKKKKKTRKCEEVFDFNEEECTICLNNNGFFYTCKTCKQQCCYMCYKQIDKCAFCRSLWKDQEEIKYESPSPAQIIDTFKEMYVSSRENNKMDVIMFILTDIMNNPNAIEIMNLLFQV